MGRGLQPMLLDARTDQTDPGTQRLAGDQLRGVNCHGRGRAVGGRRDCRQHSTAQQRFLALQAPLPSALPAHTTYDARHHLKLTMPRRCLPSPSFPPIHRSFPFALQQRTTFSRTTTCRQRRARALPRTSQLRITCHTLLLLLFPPPGLLLLPGPLRLLCPSWCWY
eukprot:3304014-Rhodomonas_salina.1